MAEGLAKTGASYTDGSFSIEGLSHEVFLSLMFLSVKVVLFLLDRTNHCIVGIFGGFFFDTVRAFQRSFTLPEASHLARYLSSS